MIYLLIVLIIKSSFLFNFSFLGSFNFYLLSFLISFSQDLFSVFFFFNNLNLQSIINFFSLLLLKLLLGNFNRIFIIDELIITEFISLFSIIQSSLRVSRADHINLIVFSLFLSISINSNSLSRFLSI